MNEQKELELMQGLYDRIYDMLTYAPKGKDSGFSDQTTLFQMVPVGIPVNPDDYANQFSPVNPKGNMNAAEFFSALVDAKPMAQSIYARSSESIESIYGNIIRYANTAQAPNKEQLELYNKAKAFLEQEIEVEDFMGNKTKQTQNSPIYNAYVTNKTAYVTAVSSYRNAYNNYDLDKTEDQRSWQANEPMLRLAVENSYNTWQNNGAARVEEAMSAMATSLNNATAGILSQEKQRFDSSQLASSTGAGSPWHLSYASPSNWTNLEAPIFTSMKLDSNSVKLSDNSNFEQYGGKTTFQMGLWSHSVSGEYSKQEDKCHLQSSSLQISLDLAVVNIMRPWFNSSIFKIHGWTNDAYPDGSISSGKFNDKAAALPLVPTGMVVIKNLVINGDFKDEDKDLITKSTSGQGEIGIGPFKVGGSYQSGNKTYNIDTTFENGSLSVPGLQIIGFISEVIPFSPKAEK